MSETLPDPTVKSEPGADPVIPPPSSDYDALMARLQESPHDPESWKRLVDLAETSPKGKDYLPRIRQTYDALLERYPNTAAAQMAYINHFLNKDQPHLFATAEQLLNKFLRTSPSVELWKFYLDYVREVNISPTTRDIVHKAYDYALNHIGQDRDSGSIWAKYIQFLSDAETTGTRDEQLKMDALRKVYHRAVQIPLDNVEQLWSDLEAFETGLNKITAKKFMQDLTPAYMQARTVLRQLSVHMQGLGMPDPTKLFIPALPTFSPQERPFIGRWKAYLRWEESNPLEIEEKDRGTLNSRIQMVYRKAVIRMRYYPEIWFMAFSWTASIGKNDEALSILKAGLEANTDSFALTYAYAEYLEKAELKKDQRDYSEVHAVYERFFGVLRTNLARLSEEAAASAPALVPPSETPVIEEPSLEANGSSETAPANPPAVNQNQDELTERKRQYSNAWINYMRFARRAQGQQAGRDAFGKARRDEYISWEVFEAAALTEYRCNPDDGRHVASRIFEAGMKRFGTEVAYVLSHLGFLLTINDENNARALFERVIGTFTPQQAKPIWERWSRSQYQYDDLEAVLELERRMAEVYPSDAPIKRFAQRHTYHSIDAIADHDLGFAKARKLGPAGIRLETTPSFPPSAPGRSNGIEVSSSLLTIPNPNKRPPPPPDRKRENDYKRPRPDDRPGERDRARRYVSPPPPPSWERDRDRDVKPPPPPPRRDPPREEKPATLPPVIHRFIAQLPPSDVFNGPIFNVDNLMDKLRNAVIPSTSARVRSPPPPPRSSGRPPPDYGPYQGPGSMPRRGRY
ncbi:Suf-domain-containing protein [Mycena galericulata]|nr:Suf-domain-containing protein [Mycena galericulata]